MNKPHKSEYKGHEIDVAREESLGGEDLLFYSVFRKNDGYECTSGFSYDESTPDQFAKLLEARIDDELKSENPWDEGQ